jgi:hypothetical protein
MLICLTVVGSQMILTPDRPLELKARWTLFSSKIEQRV